MLCYVAVYFFSGVKLAASRAFFHFFGLDCASIVCARMFLPTQAMDNGPFVGSLRCWFFRACSLLIGLNQGL